MNPRAVWANSIGNAAGPLPGSVLDALVTPHGWCGTVQTVGSAQRVVDAADTIAAAFGLPARSVVVQPTGDSTAFLWAYKTRSGADYHRHWPSSVLDGTEFVDVAPPSSGASLLDFVRLTEMARKHQRDWAELRSGQPVDLQHFAERLTLLRAGILDVLARARPAQVREVLIRIGVTHESLPADLAVAIDYPVGDPPTIPRVRL